MQYYFDIAITKYKKYKKLFDKSKLKRQIRVFETFVNIY